MATSQYIGARYVPIFYTNPDDGSNAWQAGVAYDPLTIVTDLNQSYTSKIPVPANIGRPSENPTYWIMTGAYNAQVDQYRTEVAGYREDVTQLEEDFQQLSTDVSEELALLASKRVHGRRFIVLADSYGVRTNASGYTFMELFRRYAGIAADDFYSGAVGGGAFAQTNTSLKFLTLLQSITPNVNNPKTITDIIIQCGANDLVFGKTATITACAEFAAYAFENFPNANINICACGLTYKTPQLSQRHDVIDAFKAAAAYGMGLIVNSPYIIADPRLLENDHCHPLASGVEVIAQQLLNFAVNNQMDANFLNESPTCDGVSFMQHTSAMTTNREYYFIESSNNGHVCCNRKSTNDMIVCQMYQSIAVNALEEIRVYMPKSMLIGGPGSQGAVYANVHDRRGGTIVPAYCITATADGDNVLRIFPLEAVPETESIGLNFALDFNL